MKKIRHCITAQTGKETYHIIIYINLEREKEKNSKRREFSRNFENRLAYVITSLSFITT